MWYTVYLEVAGVARTTTVKAPNQGEAMRQAQLETGWEGRVLFVEEDEDLMHGVLR
jgi:hypothetical protein